MSRRLALICREKQRDRAHVRRFAAAIALLAVSWPLLASADDTRPWNIDFFQGPLVTSERVIGLGGGFVGVSDGVEGHLSNPAAFAVRSPFMGNDSFDFDLGTAGYTVVGDNDYDQSGNKGALQSATAQQLGFNLKFGRFGIGAHFLSQQFRMEVKDDEGVQSVFSYAQSYGGIGLAWAFRDGELVMGTLIGIGTARLSSLNTTATEVNGKQVDLASAIYPSAFGLLYCPRGLPYRLGMSWRLGREMTQERAENFGGTKIEKLNGLRVPDKALMGASFELGASWMFGQRTYNIRPSYGDLPLPVGSVPVKAIKRRYVLVTASIKATGPVEDGVGVTSYLRGVRQQSGAGPVVSGHFGAESEIYEDRLRVRGGWYREPSRFADDARHHVTFGADLRISLIIRWRLTMAVDVAKDYRNTAFGIGLWN